MISSSAPKEMLNRLKGTNLPAGVMWQRPLWKALLRLGLPPCWWVCSGPPKGLIWWWNTHLCSWLCLGIL